jgi:hypothetical protein
MMNVGDEVENNDWIDGDDDEHYYYIMIMIIIMIIMMNIDEVEMNMDDDQQVWSSPMMLIKIIAILSKL